MNTNETARIMKMFKAAYPDFDKNGDAKDIAALWAWRFKDADFKAVFAAVGDYIDGDHAFAPTVGQIKAIMNDKVPKLSAADGWAEITKALKDSLSNARSEFEKLSPPVRAYVEGPETLRMLAGCDVAGRAYQDYQAQFFKTFAQMQGKFTERPDYAALNAAEAKALGQYTGDSGVPGSSV